MGKASQQEINSFLLQVKLIIEDGENFILRSDRPDNEQTLYKLGFTPKNACDELMILTYKDYLDGPSENRSKDGEKCGEIWEFGKRIDSLDVYIKFHILIYKGITRVICISFHEAKFKMIYSYK